MNEDLADILDELSGGEDRWRLVMLAASITRWLSFEDIAYVLKDPAYSGFGRPMKDTRTSRLIARLRQLQVMEYSHNNRYRLTHRGKMVAVWGILSNEWSAKDLVSMCEAMQTKGRRIWAQDRVLAPEFQRMQAVREIVENRKIK